LFAATLYQGNPDRNHHLWNIGTTEKYSMCRFCYNVITQKWKVYIEKIEIISFVVKISFLTPSTITFEMYVKA
jgi:hypothetical protein